jgi:hypothetical protein
MGVFMVLLMSTASELIVDAGVKVVARITVPTQIEQLKTRLKA